MILLWLTPDEFYSTRGPLGQEVVKNYLPNSFGSVPDFGILLWLTPDDFSRQVESSRVQKIKAWTFVPTDLM